MAGNLSLTREYDRIYTIVRDQIEPYLFDIVSTKTSLLYRMRDMGAIPKVGGRADLSFGIFKALPTSIGYSDDDTITPTRPDPWTRARFIWKQIACAVKISGLDMIKTGGGGEIDLLEGMIQAAETSLKETLGDATTGIYSNGDEDNPRKISGLQNHFPSTYTTGTCGGLNRATLTKWRNRYENIASDFSANGLAKIRSMHIDCSKFDQIPDTLVGTKSFMINFENTCTGTINTNMPLMGKSDERMMDVGYPNIGYKGMLIFADDNCPSNAAYMLNLRKFVKLYVREGRDAELGDFVKPVGDDVLTFAVYWAGNLCNTDLSSGGLLANGDTD